MDNRDKKFDIIVIGEGAVGKTCLLKMYLENVFDPSHMVTMGLDNVTTTYTPKGTSQPLRYKIWDTAGQERFRTLTHSFYKLAQGVVIVFDVTNELSFNNVKKWIESIYDHADQNVCKVLVGNKIDIEDERRITRKEAVELAKLYNIKYFEASARTKKGVEVFFEEIFEQVYKKRFEIPEEREPSFTLNRSQQ